MTLPPAPFGATGKPAVCFRRPGLWPRAGDCLAQALGFQMVNILGAMESNTSAHPDGKTSAINNKTKSERPQPQRIQIRSRRSTKAGPLDSNTSGLTPGEGGAPVKPVPPPACFGLSSAVACNQLNWPDLPR